MKWRTGRKVGRTIYRQEGASPSGMDLLIGLMDTREEATLAAAAPDLLAALEACVDPDNPNWSEACAVAVAAIAKAKGEHHRT